MNWKVMVMVEELVDAIERAIEKHAALRARKSVASMLELLPRARKRRARRA